MSLAATALVERKPGAVRDMSHLGAYAALADPRKEFHQGRRSNIFMRSINT